MDLSFDVIEFTCGKVRIGIIFSHLRTFILSLVTLLFLILTCFGQDINISRH